MGDPAPDNNTEKVYDLPEEKVNYDIDFTQHVELPELETLELAYMKSEPDDKTISQVIYNLQLGKATRTEVTDRAAQNGDVVTINYSAVYFGTDEKFADRKNVEISLGQGVAIRELEEAIVGMTKGETKSTDIVYPADRTTSKALANAKTTFTIELIKIETAALPELNAETIKSFDLGVSSYEDLRELLIFRIEQQNALYKQDALYKTLIQQAKLISMPKTAYDYYLDLFDRNTEAAAQSMSVTVDNYKATNYPNEGDYEAAREKDAQDNVLKDLVIYSLKKEFSVEVTKEEYNLALKETFKEKASSLGISTMDDFHDKMGNSVYMMELNYQVMEAAAKVVPDKE